jgi:hypothetical protein
VRLGQPRLLALRHTHLAWQKWNWVLRLRRLERRCMERQAREHLVEWVAIMRLRVRRPSPVVRLAGRVSVGHPAGC